MGSNLGNENLCRVGAGGTERCASKKIGKGSRPFGDGWGRPGETRNAGGKELPLNQNGLGDQKRN